MNKPGVKTSEFYLVIASYVLSFLVMTGFVSQQTANDLTQPVAIMLSGLITLGTTIAYIKSRTELKQALQEEPAELPPGVPATTPTVETPAP